MTAALGVGLEGRRVRLERLRVPHVQALYEMAQEPQWQLAGGGLDPDEFVDRLWQASPVQFSLVRRDTDEVIGLTRGLRWDKRGRTIEVVLGLAPAYWKQVWPLEGAVIFCDYLFRGLGMRKLYFELLPSSMVALGSWLQRECNRGWVKRGERLSADSAPEDVEVWSLAGLNHDRVDRLLGRSSTRAPDGDGVVEALPGPTSPTVPTP